MTLLVCPQDKATLQIDGEQATCTDCNHSYQKVDGIWRMLTADQEAAFAPFIRDYETIRQAEGRTEQTAEWYRKLPTPLPDDPMAEMWQQRSHSFNHLLKEIIHPLEKENPSFALNIADLGAGNCWLSHRLAARSHEVMAIDIITNRADGLGCHSQYQHPFTAVQASFEQLSLPQDSIDLVIFNASFHYATSYESILQEAQEVLKPNGRIIVIDTPVYRQEISGSEMVIEREARFTERYGFPSNQLNSEHFLTYRRITKLADKLRTRYQLFHLHTLAKRTWRRAKVRANGSREAAEFPIIVWHK